MNPITSVVLNLKFKPSYVPKSIANFLYDLSKIDNESDKLTMLSDYICKQEEELRRVEALNVELPQFRLLLMDGIKTLKEEFKNIKDNMESGSEQASQHLVEYLPTKRKNDAEEQLEVQREIREAYLAEVEYWNPNHAKKQKALAIDDFLLKDELEPLNKRENSSNSLGSSSNEKENEKEVGMDESSKHQPSFDLNDPTLNYHPKPLTQPIWKYNRRHWTPELHARFVEALNLLGGIEVATPKKIRDLMQVQELTVDQVKSHLQKYRLHCGKLLTSSLQ